MSPPVDFESREMKLNRSIENEVRKIRETDPLSLPEAGDPIVWDYIQKIEGTYNVDGAKKDTDYAIDLLYIAYNTTPQEEGEIRVKINKIMDSLLHAQVDSRKTMRRAMDASSDVLSILSSALPDWLDAKEDRNSTAKMKKFVAGDLREAALEIKAKAQAVQAELAKVASSYGAIIKETLDVTSSSELALMDRLKQKTLVDKELGEVAAERDRLDSLVADLQRQVSRFQALADKYEQQAETAEQRAFIMQIVRVAAQVVAAAIPPIAMAAASGGTSVIAGAALTAGTQAIAPKKADATADSTKREIDLGKEISVAKKDLAQAEKARDTAKSAVMEKRQALKKELGTKAVSSKSEPGAIEGEDEEAPDDPPAVKSVKGVLKSAKEELATKEEAVATLDGRLGGLQASLQALALGMGELSKEQKEAAVSLRELQMKMLDKAETYEKEKREQAAALVKINALLTIKRTEQETIQLTIQSLNISISALKRTKEIIEEISVFFQTFAAFMEFVAKDADAEIRELNKIPVEDEIGKARMRNLIVSTEGFFIRQAAEWHATAYVADRFEKAFTEGWSNLNAKAGRYIPGDELPAYLAEAAAKLKQISDARQNAASARIADLASYRQGLRDGATPPAAAG